MEVYRQKQAVRGIQSCMAEPSDRAGLGDSCVSAAYDSMHTSACPSFGSQQMSQLSAVAHSTDYHKGTDSMFLSVEIAS